MDVRYLICFLVLFWKPCFSGAEHHGPRRDDHDEDDDDDELGLNDSHRSLLLIILVVLIVFLIFSFVFFKCWKWRLQIWQNNQRSHPLSDETPFDQVQFRTSHPYVNGNPFPHIPTITSGRSNLLPIEWTGSRNGLTQTLDPESIRITNRDSDEFPPPLTDIDDDPLEVNTRMFEGYPETPRTLLYPTQRSQTLEVENKLIVYITQEVTSKGAILILDNMGISLTVPAGAIPENEKQLIILALNWDLSDNPYMEDSQALVSPVVYCGPHGIQLLKPALLRYKHCAFDVRYIQIMESQTDLTSTKDWKIYCNAEEDEGKCIVSQDECQILLEHFTLFTSLQSPAYGEGKKWLQVAVFSPSLKPGLEHFQIRVYFLNKTPCALQWAKHNEAKFGGELVCPEKVFLLQGNREDIQLKLLYVSHDWTIVNTDEQESVNFLHIWHGMCPHTAFCFTRKISGRQTTKEIGLNFALFQECGENEADKIVIQMAETNQPAFVPIEQPLRVNVSVGKSNWCQRNTDVSVQVSQNRELNVQIDPGQTRPVGIDLDEYRRHPINTIPLDVRRSLVMMLAPKQEVGTDWRDLADKLGFKCIPFLETLPCPTSSLLDYFETQFLSLRHLHAIFMRMKRLDAASVVQEAIGTVPKTICENLDSDSDN